MTFPGNRFFPKKTGHLSKEYALNQTTTSHSEKSFHSSCRLSHFIHGHSGSLVWRWVVSCRTPSCLHREETNPCCKDTSKPVLGELTELRARSTSRSGCPKHFKSPIALCCPTVLLRSCWELVECVSTSWPHPGLQVSWYLAYKCLFALKERPPIPSQSGVQNQHLLGPVIKRIILQCAESL